MAHTSSCLVERKGDGVVKREVPPRCDGGVKHRAAARRDEPCFAVRTVARPAAERCTHVIVLDRAPQPPGPVWVPADPGHAREHTDSQDPAAVVVQLSGELQAGTRPLVCIVDLVRL